MKDWVLYDYTDPVENADQFPRASIASEADLREQLRNYAHKRPGTAVLESPQGEHLEMSIGGPLAALVWCKPPASLHNLSAVAQRLSCEEPAQFRDQGMPTHHRVEDLFPVEEVVEAVVHYYNTGQLPNWMQWRTWNPKSHEWEIKPATALPPQTVAFSR